MKVEEKIKNNDYIKRGEPIPPFVLKAKFVTYRELRMFVDGLDDIRDKLIFMLSYWGFYSVDYTALTNLKLSDYKPSKHKFHTLAGRPICSYTGYLIRKSAQEDYVNKYVKENKGYGQGMDKLIKSDYILRETESYKKRITTEKNKEFNGYAMTINSVKNRVALLKNKFNFNLTLKNVYYSRLLVEMIEKVDINSPTIRNDFVTMAQRKYGFTYSMAYRYFKIIMTDIYPKLKFENPNSRGRVY